MGGSGKARDPDDPFAPAADDRYRCSNCERALETEDVVRIDGEHRWALDFGAGTRRRTGYVLITHRCPCSGRLVVSRRYGTYPAYLALFGKGVRLPYVSPFRVVDLRDDDPLVRRWRWELGHVDTVDDFVLWVDAERRKAADELRRQRRALAEGDDA